MSYTQWSFSACAAATGGWWLTCNALILNTVAKSSMPTLCVGGEAQVNISKHVQISQKRLLMCNVAVDPFRVYNSFTLCSTETDLAKEQKDTLHMLSWHNLLYCACMTMLTLVGSQDLSTDKCETLSESCATNLIKVQQLSYAEYQTWIAFQRNIQHTTILLLRQIVGPVASVLWLTCSARNLTLCSLSSSKVSPRMGLKGFQVRSLPPNGPRQKAATQAILYHMNASQVAVSTPRIPTSTITHKAEPAIYKIRQHEQSSDREEQHMQEAIICSQPTTPCNSIEQDKYAGDDRSESTDHYFEL